MDAQAFIRGALDASRRHTLLLVEDFTDEELRKPPCPGGNPPAWVLGHIAVSEAELVAAAGGKAAPIPGGWTELFGSGRTPPAEPGRYPPREELLGFLKTARDSALNFLHGLSLKDLDRPLPEAAPKEIREFIRDLGGLFALLLNHEGTHAGGVGVARRGLGKKRLF